MTIYDIANIAGVSVSTVSKVINGYSDVGNATRAKVNAIIKQYNFSGARSARSLSTGRSGLIGIIYEESVMGLEHYVFLGILNKFKSSVEQHGYSIMFLNGKSDCDYCRLCEEWRLEGVLAMGTSPDQENIEKVSRRLPFVSADAFYKDSYTIITDNKSAIEETVGYLNELGHTRIAFLAGTLESTSSFDRFKGYKKGLENCRIRYSRILVETCDDFDFNAGYAAMDRLLSRTVPTAVVACSDFIALGAISRIKEAGLRVPEDISVVGFDDTEASRYSTPTLTSIRQDRLNTGEFAAELLMRQIDGNPPIKKHYTPKAILKERESTGKVRKEK